jgi:hypothetical protein
MQPAFATTNPNGEIKKERTAVTEMKQNAVLVFSAETDSTATASAATDTAAPAPKPKIHTVHGKNSLTFSQVSYNKWEAGGISNITLRGMSNLEYNYKKKSFHYQSIFDGAYAMTAEESNTPMKKEDRFVFTNTVGLRITKKSPFYWIALADLKSQFAPSYQVPTDKNSDIISRLFSPAYLTLSLGASYKYKDMLSVTFAPVSGRCIFVLDTAIANKGLYEVKKGYTTESHMGCYASVVFSKTLWKNFSYNSKLELFSNYKDNPQNIDMDWENKFYMKLTAFFAIELYIRLVYKDKARYQEKLPDGSFLTRGPALQVNQSLNIGLTYMF